MSVVNVDNRDAKEENYITIKYAVFVSFICAGYTNPEIFDMTF